MNIRFIALTIIVTLSTFHAPATKAVSQWAIQQAQLQVAQAQAQQNAMLIIAVAEEIEQREYERQQREKEKQLINVLCALTGYCVYNLGKGMFFVAAKTCKAALYATTSTAKTVYLSVVKPEELQKKIKDGEIEPFVGIACLTALFTASIVQIINAATT